MYASTTHATSTVLGGLDFSNIDKLTLLATIAVAIFGWIIALLLQRSNAKHQHKIQVRYDIYKQLLRASERTQDKVNKIVIIFPPLISMEASMIPFQVKLKSEQECVFEGGKKWLEFIKSVVDNYFGFTDAYLEMFQIFESWAAAIEPLLETKKILIQEVQTLSNQMQKNVSELQMYQNGKYDWRNWDKKEVEAIAKKIRDDAQTVGMYLHDFMVLVHNELLSKYFGYARPIRRTLDERYKVLTKDGIVVRLESNHEKLLQDMIGKEKI